MLKKSICTGAAAVNFRQNCFKNTAEHAKEKHYKTAGAKVQHKKSSGGNFFPAEP